MNITAKLTAQHRYQTQTPTLAWIRYPKLLNLVFIVGILITAFAIIYLKHINRQYFIQFQTLQTTHDKLFEERGKLLLEQSTWAAQARVQKIAEQRLGMVLPSPKEVELLRLHS